VRRICACLCRAHWRGRHSSEYYGRSVILGLAPAGDPAIRPCCTYRARHRPPRSSASPRSLHGAAYLGRCPAPILIARQDMPPVPGVILVSDRFTAGVSFRQSSLDHVARALRHPVLNASGQPRFPGMLLSPRPSPQGRPGDPWTLLPNPSRLHRGYSKAPHDARMTRGESACSLSR
jgi:hypothetical protein